MAGQPGAVGHEQRHALVLVRVAALPFGAQRRETIRGKRVQHAAELGQHAGQQPVAVGRGAASTLEIGRRLPDARARRLRQPHVDADADHGRGRPERVSSQLGQDAGELGVVANNVVRPLESDAVRTGRRERAGEGHAHRQRQAGKRAGPAREAPQQGECERLAQPRVPGAPEPAAPARLPFHDDHGTARRAGRRTFQQRRVGGVRLMTNIEREAPGIRSEVALDGGAIEQRDRVRQAVAAAVHSVDFNARRLQVADRVPHARARYLEAARQCLAGMEAAVSQPCEYACGQGFHGAGIE